VAQPWRLPGQYADGEFGLGLHYNRFRYYDPIIGRYISRDPIGVAGGLNLYAYVGNDPINRADPQGLFWGTVGLVLAAVAVAVVVLAPAEIAVGAVLAGIAVAAVVGALIGGAIEAFTQKTFCLACILEAGLRGAALGVIGLAPFLLTPFVGAGYLAVTGLGAASGLVTYLADFATGDKPWSWQALGLSMALGAALGPLGKYLGGKIAARWPRASAPEAAPATVAEPVIAPKRSVTSPNAAMRAAANESGTYVDPLTGKVVPANGGLAADHIVPQKWIKAQPGFKDLSPADQSALLNDPLNTQGLPQSLNSSKGAKMPGDWTTYKGQALDPNYVANDAARAAKLRQYFEDQIKLKSGN
jgi:RHS repeat-associated protein